MGGALNSSSEDNDSSKSVLPKKINGQTIFGMDYSYLQNPQSALAARPQPPPEQTRDITAIWDRLKQTDPKLHVCVFPLCDR